LNEKITKERVRNFKIGIKAKSALKRFFYRTQIGGRASVRLFFVAFASHFDKGVLDGSEDAVVDVSF